jgi:hypothetical protein
MEQKEQQQQPSLEVPKMKPERRRRQKQKSLVGRSSHRGRSNHEEDDPTDFFSNPIHKKNPHGDDHRPLQEEGEEPLMGPLLRRKKVTSLPLLDHRRHVEFFGEGRRQQPRQRQQSDPQLTMATTGTGRSHGQHIHNKTTTPIPPPSNTNKPSSFLGRILHRKQVALDLLPPEALETVRERTNSINSRSTTDKKRNTTTKKGPLQFSPRAG